MTIAPDTAVLKPWTIKSIDPRVSDAIVAEARRTGITAGQLVERMWAAWQDQGSPVRVAGSEMTEVEKTSRMQAMAALLQGMAAVKTAGVRGWRKDAVAALHLPRPDGYAVGSDPG